jgi:hypothetical protein
MDDKRAKFEAWYVDFYREPLPAEYRVVDIWECWKAAYQAGESDCIKAYDHAAVRAAASLSQEKPHG